MKGGERVSQLRRHKYNAEKTIIDGILFPSRREAEYYCDLKLSEKAKEIKTFFLQPSFTLQDAFTDNTGKKHRDIKYIADFMILHNDGTEEVVDVKASKTFQTEVYRLKKKLFLSRYKQYKFTEVY